MNNLKELMEKASSLCDEKKNLQEEMKILNAKKDKICQENVKNILIPFLQEVLNPIHKMYIDNVSSAIRDKDSYIINPNGKNRQEYMMLNGHYYSLMGKGDSLYNNPVEDEKYLYKVHHGYFPYFGTVEDTQKVVDDLKDILIDECNLVIETLTESNKALAETVESIKEDLRNASAVKINKESDDIKLMINGIEYKCVKAEV